MAKQAEIDLKLAVSVTMEAKRPWFAHEDLTDTGFRIRGQDLAIGSVSPCGFKESIVFNDLLFPVIRESKDHPAYDHDAVFVAQANGFARRIDDLSLFGSLKMFL